MTRRVDETHAVDLHPVREWKIDREGLRMPLRKIVVLDEFLKTLTRLDARLLQEESQESIRDDHAFFVVGDDPSIEGVNADPGC
jgi:hypothetical protein